MTYPQQPGWSDPTSGGAYIDPATGQPAYPTSPGAYPPGQGGQMPSQPAPGYAAPGYPAPAYPGAIGYPPPAQPTNGMAIASLVLSLCGMLCGITGLVGAILGHVARRQIRERGEGGAGLALAGIIAGWITFGLAVIAVTIYVIAVIWLVKNQAQQPDPFPTY